MQDVKASVQQQFGNVASNYATSTVHASGEDLNRMVQLAELSEAIVIAFDVKDDTIVAHKTSVSIVSANVYRRLPLRTTCDQVPRTQWLFGIRVYL